MEFVLSEDQESQIKQYVFNVVQSAIKNASDNKKPYLNRKEAAAFLGVAPSTIDIFVRQGMPVAVIDGRKLYGKESMTRWLKSKEVNLNE